MIKQQLSQSLQQKLSPLQIQQIKMLELNSLEIEERIRQELEENPALEEGGDWQENVDDQGDSNEEFDSAQDFSSDDLSLGDYYSDDDDIPDYKFHENNYSKDVPKEQFFYSEPESFHQHSLGQLALRHLSERETKICEYIIGNIDDDGYLRRDLSSISDDLLFNATVDVSVEELEKLLTVVQDLDPAGIGARDLQECLLLQIKKKTKTEIREIAQNILENYFDDFTRKHYDKIKKGLDLSDDILKQAIKEITLLNPKPGNLWSDEMETKLSQVVPDFIVEDANGELVLHMNNEEIPELRVSKEYSDMFKEYANNKKNQSQEVKETVFFVKQKLDSAKWFIDAIKQRQGTLKNVMLAIMELQHDFFLSGDESDLRPMILKDISELCGYDISTISRVSNSKYVQTNFGIYSLKYFFSESLQNESGEEVSTREIKAILKDCIDDEDKSAPLTDEKLVILLKQKGYEVARRTVAKYREQMEIPVARLRKEL